MELAEVEPVVVKDGRIVSGFAGLDKSVKVEVFLTE